MRKVNDLRVQIFDICAEYRQVIHTLYCGRGLSQKENVACLNRQSDEVIKSSVDYVKPKQRIDPISQNRAQSYFPVLTKMMNELEYLFGEIKQRNITYASSMFQNKKSFEQEAKLLHERYIAERRLAIKNNKEYSEKLADDIRDLKRTWDARLAIKVGQCIDSKNSLKNSLERLKEDFANMKSKMNASLTVTERKVAELQQQLELLDDKNAKLLKTLEADYATKLGFEESRCKHLIGRLEGIRNNLLKESETKRSVQVKQLTESETKLSMLKKSAEQEFMKRQSVRQEELDLELEAMMVSNEKAEAELRSRFTKQKETNAETIQLLKNVLDSLKIQLISIQQNTRQKLAAEEEKAKQQLSEKDDLYRKASQDNKNSVKEAQDKNDDELKTLSDLHVHEISKLEKELIGVAEATENKTSELQTQVSDLIRLKAQMEREYEEVKRALDAPDTPLSRLSLHTATVASVRPDVGQAQRVLMSTSNMTSRVQKFEHLIKQRMSELKELKARKETELKKLQQRNKELILRAEKRSKSLEEENVEIRKQCETMDLKMTGLIEQAKAQNLKKNSDLKVKLAMQHDTISELTESIQLARVEDLKKVQLTLAISDKRERVRYLQDQISSFSDDKRIENERVIGQFELKLAEERAKHRSMITAASDKLSAALEELAQVKSDHMDDVMKDWQKWMELRTDIADANFKVMQTVERASRPPTSASRVGTASRQRTPGLPPL